MSTLRTKELTVSRTIFMVCCGNISKAIIIQEPMLCTSTFSRQGIEKLKVMFLTGKDSTDLPLNVISEVYLTDYGVTDCKNRYDNKVNAILGSYEEAKKLIESDSYKKALSEHREEVDSLFIDVYSYDYE